MIDIFSMTHWSWLVLGLLLLGMELLMTFMFFLWLGVSALVTALVLFLYPEMDWKVQFLLFSVLSMVSLVVSYKYFRGRQIGTELPNLNRRGQQYVGRVFTLAEPITNGYGKISVDDTHWRVTGPPLDAGVHVKVVAANGSVLDVEPYSTS